VRKNLDFTCALIPAHLCFSRLNRILVIVSHRLMEGGFGTINGRIGVHSWPLDCGYGCFCTICVTCSIARPNSASALPRSFNLFNEITISGMVLATILFFQFGCFRYGFRYYRILLKICIRDRPDIWLPIIENPSDFYRYNLVDSDRRSVDDLSFC